MLLSRAVGSIDLVGARRIDRLPSSCSPPPPRLVLDLIVTCLPESRTTTLLLLCRLWCLSRHASPPCLFSCVSYNMRLCLHRISVQGVRQSPGRLQRPSRGDRADRARQEAAVELGVQASFGQDLRQGGPDAGHDCRRVRQRQPLDCC